MVNQGWPKPNIARLKKTGQEKFNLWDSQGFLTEDGIQASEEGIVHVPENGKLRLWVINHPIAGIVPIHATEEANLPIHQEATNKDNNAILSYRNPIEVVVSRLCLILKDSNLNGLNYYPSTRIEIGLATKLFRQRLN